MNPHPSGWATSFLSCEWNPLFLSEDWLKSSGVPIEVSRKGKASPGHTHEVWVGLEGASIPRLPR